jgi:hypothetical protein
MAPLELERLKEFDEYEQFAGVEFVPACPLTYLTIHNDGLENMLADSGKLHYTTCPAPSSGPPKTA